MFGAEASRRLALVLAGLVIAEAIAIMVLGGAGDPRFTLPLDLTIVAFFGTMIAFPVVGALIIQRRPLTRVAWVMVALGVGLGLALVTYGYGVVGQPPRSLPGATAALIVSQLFFLPSSGTAITVLLLLFPTDRLAGPRWRSVLLAALGGAALYTIGSLLRPGSIDPEALPDVPNPLGAPVELSAALDAAVLAGNALVIGAILLAAASLIVRYRRADSIEAAQIRWIALFGTIAAVSLAISALQLGPVSDLLFGLGFVFLACVPIAIGIAITRYRLYEIDRLINRALVYGSLTAILAGVFTAAVGLAQRLFVAMTGETSDAALVGTTLVVATLYTPLRRRLETVIDRRFKYEQRTFGSYRDELRRTLSLVDAEAAADRLAREVARETGAVSVAVLGASGAPTATVGPWPVASSTATPVVGGHGAIVEVVVSPRAGGAPIDPARLAEIEELAALAARAVRRSDAR